MRYPMLPRPVDPINPKYDPERMTGGESEPMNPISDAIVRAKRALATRTSNTRSLVSFG